MGVELTENIMAATMSVTRADQEKINNALDEIELHDEDTDGKIPYQMGDLYVFLTQEETEEYIRDEQRNAAKRMNVLEDKKKDNDKHLKTLKQDLYEKFGKDINLEDEA